MRDETGFTPVGDFATGELAPQVGVGILGYAFMGKAHSNAYRKIPYIMDPPPAVPKLIAMCGRNEDAVARAARRYGYQGYYTDWHKLMENDDIQLVDNSAPPFMHHDPCVMAVQAGKHVLCEKPLARTAQEAKAMWEAAQKSGVKHMTGFNYRFVWISNWWPRGHVIGWEHTFVHEIAHLLDCIVNDRDVGPYGATFEDGYRANVVSDAVMLSAMTKSQVDIKYW